MPHRHHADGGSRLGPYLDRAPGSCLPPQAPRRWANALLRLAPAAGFVVLLAACWIAPIWLSGATTLSGAAAAELPSPGNGPSAPVYDGDSQLPACSSRQAFEEVKRGVDKEDSVQSAHLSMVSLDNSEQVGSTDNLRSCRGTATLSDETRQTIRYAFETKPEPGFRVHVTLDILPTCPSEGAWRNVKSLVEGRDSLQAGHLTAITLDDRQQLGSTADLRTCQGIVTLSDGTRHIVGYSFEPGPGDQYFARLQMSMLPTCASATAREQVMRLANRLDSLTSTKRTATGLADPVEIGSNDQQRSCSGILLVSDGSRRAMTYSFQRRPLDMSAEIKVQ